jgi:predicted DCC family thiol-disulfide oxidoreductase YuxK
MKTVNGLSGIHGIVVFDQDCALCNFWVRFLLKHDSEGMFYFAGQYSEWYAVHSARIEEAGAVVSAGVVLVEPSGDVSAGVMAVTRLLQMLGGRWRLLLVYRIFPLLLQRWMYRLISRNRYRWFGRQTTSCQILMPEYSKRFLP